MRRAIVVVFPLLLAGCGLPPVISITSYVIDGVSYVSSGKSVSDHAISAAADEDCAVWRVIKDQPICREYKNGERGILVAFAENLENAELSDAPNVEISPETIVYQDVEPARQVASADPVMVPVDMAGLVPSVKGVAAISVPLQADAAPFFGGLTVGAAAAESAGLIAAVGRNSVVVPVPASAGWTPVLTIAPLVSAQLSDADQVVAVGKPAANTVLVVGSFRRKVNAERVAGNWRKLKPAVVPVRVGGRTYFRVVTGPIAGNAVKGQRKILSMAGLRDVWAATLCRADGAKPGCIALPGRPGSRP